MLIPVDPDHPNQPPRDQDPAFSPTNPVQLRTDDGAVLVKLVHFTPQRPTWKKARGRRGEFWVRLQNTESQIQLLIKPEVSLELLDVQDAEGRVFHVLVRSRQSSRAGTLVTGTVIP